MTITITIHGGAGEVGGNKILVHDKGHDIRFFLDFGKSFETMRQFYDFPVVPRSLDDLLQINATPDIPNLYHQPELKTAKASDIDAVILSHAHLDHSGYIPLLNRSIKIYMGECTKHIFTARMQGSRKTFDTDIEDLEILTFKTGDKIRLGNVEILPVHVDHSIPAAYGFIIHCSEASFVYTGDFRRHGTRPDLTQDFIEAVGQAGKPDVVLTEGTNIARAELATEDEVQQKVRMIIQGCHGLAIIDFSENDFDRFRTIRNVAKATGRQLVVEPRRMWVLHAINQCQNLNKPNVASDPDIKWFDAEKKRRSKYERLLGDADPALQDLEGRAVGVEVLRGSPQDYIYCTSFGSLSTIQQLKPPASGIYLRSASEPFNEESEISFDKLRNWLVLSGLAIYSAHCSGHIHPIDLGQTLEEMQPNLIVPIHTDHPQMVQRFLSSSGICVQIPKRGVSFKVG